MANNDSLAAELSNDLSFFMNLSIESQLQNRTSTPKKNRTRTVVSKVLFKKPPVRPARQNPVVATCKQCGKEYRTLRYYKTHMQGHTLKDIASKVPGQDNVMDLAPEVSADVLKSMESKPSVGLHAVEFQKLLEILKPLQTDPKWQEIASLICENFKELLSAQLFCMPSSLINTALKIVDNILASFCVRDSILVKLRDINPEIQNICDDVLNSFLCEFVLTFADILLINLFRRLRNASGDSTVKKVVFDEAERQTIFYIGGSICHGFKQMGYKYPNSKKWKIIIEVLQTKIMETRIFDELSDQEKKDRSWTDKKDRGGLVKIKGCMQEFLLSSAEIVACHEESDGSLPIETILGKAVEGKPKYDWDTVVGNAMEESLSLSLMVGILRSFINTYGKGIIYRRMNQINNNKAIVSSNLRHKVAPKS